MGLFERTHVVGRLRAAGCVAAEEEAEQLVAAAGGRRATLDALVRRREEGEPLAWITAGLRFCGRTVRVDPGVYVPRVQTEELARRAASLLPASGRAVDLCTGTGAIAGHLMATVPSATVAGLDVDRLAVACARRNGVAAVLADVARTPFGPRTFDVVTAVAPYVPSGDLAFLPADVQRYEPRRALDGGDDGLDLVRMVVLSAASLLKRGGWLLTELGGTQDELLAPALAAAGFGGATAWFDKDGDLRGIAVQVASA